MRRQGKIWLMIVGLLLASMFAATALAAQEAVEVLDMDGLIKAVQDKGVTNIDLMFEADFAEVAKVLKNNAQVTINSNGHGMYIGENLLLKDGASVELKGKASDNMGVLKFDDGAKIELQRISNFTLLYDGTNLCTQNHDDVSECTAEGYECCENMLLAGNGIFTVEAAKEYAGHFDVSITYLDGKTVETTDLSTVTYDKLRGAVELSIKYVKPKTTSVSGKLVWDDGKNEFETRPKSVTIDLYRNGKKTDESKKIDGGKFTFTNLLVEDADGNDYTYTVRMRDSLKPLYTTKNNDKKHTITNKLNTVEIIIYHQNAATHEDILEPDVAVIPYDWTLVMDEAEFNDGRYRLVDGAESEVTLPHIKEDGEYVFFYDEYVTLSGTHEYIEEEGNTGYRFENLDITVKRNGQALGALMINTDKAKSSFETGYDYRKYDGGGKVYEYTLALDQTKPGYTQSYTGKNGSFVVVSRLNDVEVKVLYVYCSDSQHTRGNGSPVFNTKSFTKKYGSAFTCELPASATYNNKTVKLSGARTDDGYDTNGQTNTIEVSPLIGDVTITAAYID